MTLTKEDNLKDMFIAQTPNYPLHKKTFFSPSKQNSGLNNTLAKTSPAKNDNDSNAIKPSPNLDYVPPAF